MSFQGFESVPAYCLYLSFFIAYSNLIYPFLLQEECFCLLKSRILLRLVYQAHPLIYLSSLLKIYVKSFFG